MNPTDPAFPGSDDPTIYLRPGMDLRTYMATAFLAAQIAKDHMFFDDATRNARADLAALQADALIARLNAKTP